VPQSGNGRLFQSGKRLHWKVTLRYQRQRKRPRAPQLVALALALLPALAAGAPAKAVLVVVGSGRAEVTSAVASIGRPSLVVAPDTVIAVALAHDALGAAPRRFAHTHFDRCIDALVRAKRALAPWHDRHPDALPLLKQLHQWIGLCRAAKGDSAGAAADFAIATLLPGPPPDLDTFSPPVLALYRRAQRQNTARCSVATQQLLSVDGRAVDEDTRVSPGEHYAVWQPTPSVANAVSCAGRVVVDRHCRWTPVDAATGPDGRCVRAPVTISDSQALSASLLKAISTATGASAVWGIQLTGSTLRARKYDRAAARCVERTRGVLPPHTSARRRGEALAQQIARMAPWRTPTSLATHRPVGHARSHSTTATASARSTSQAVEPPVSPISHRLWYRRWWFWTAIGIVVAAAVVVPVVTTHGSGDNNSGYDLVF